MYRLLSAIVFISSFLSLLSQDKSTIYINNPNQFELYFFDYGNQDTLFKTGFVKDTVILGNNNNMRTIIIYNKTYPRKFNSIVLSSKVLDVDFSNFILDFDTDLINIKHQVFKSQLDSLKKYNTPREYINTYVYAYMISNPNLYMSLDFLYQSLVFDSFSKDSCILLFNKLNKELKYYKDLWGKVEVLINTEYDLIKEGSLLKKYLVSDTNRSVIKLEIPKKKTIIIFWANWCSPCKKKIKLLNKDFKKISLLYNIVYISLDETDVWLKSIKTNKIEHFVNYSLTEGFSNIMVKELNIKSIPYNLIIDKFGYIEYFNKSIYKFDTLKINLLYEQNKFELLEDHKKILSEQFNSIGIDNIFKINISGFSSSKGNVKDNFILSEKRSLKVNKFCDDLFISSEANFFGEEFSDKKSNLNDRRVELSISYLTLDNNLFEYQMFNKFKVDSTLVLANLFFVPGEAYIKAESFKTLKNLQSYLFAYPSIEIELQGHVDLVKNWNGSDYHNLSTRRAKFIYDYLVNGGINKSRLSYKGLGNSIPLYDTNSKKSELNMRVEIYRKK